MADKLPLPIPPIAPVELMLVSIGLKPIISKEVETISPAKLAEMDKIPDEIRKLSDQLVHGKDVEVPDYAEFDYRAAIKELAAGWDVQQVKDMVAKFPPQYKIVGTALIVKAQETIKQLLQGYPVAQYQTLTGSIDLLPSDVKLFKFVSILEIVDEPLNVFKFMGTGSLLKTQARAVRVVYPTLSAAIDAAIFNATISAKAANKSFELPPRAEYGVKNWFGKSQVSSSMLQQAQKNHANANSKKMATQKPPPENGKIVGDMLTSTQRAEAKPSATT